MLQPVKSLDELIDYLSKLESRITSLEAENAKLRTLTIDNSREDRNELKTYVDSVVPSTNIINPNFLKRAFAVWGHFFVANLIIGIIVGIGYLCFMAVIFGAFGALLSNSNK